MGPELSTAETYALETRRPDRSVRRGLNESRVRPVIEYWRAELGIPQRVHVERISRYQVTDECGRWGCSLVGVSYDEQTACIHHTRSLTVEDIVHELLHVACPAWSEGEVVAETARLLQPSFDNGRRARSRR